MKYRFLIIATVISFAAHAQKKSAKKSLPPPPPVRSEYDMGYSKDHKNPFPESITFKWNNTPEMSITLTPTDVFEKSYTFEGQGRHVRISTAYPTQTFEYKKPNKGEIEMAQALTIRYTDYKNVTITGNNISIVSDDGKEKIKLQLVKKGNQLIQLKELNTGKLFSKTDSYVGEPTISL